MQGSTLVEAAQAALGEGDLAGALAHLHEAVAAGRNPVARELLGGLLFFDDDLAGAHRELEVAFREWKEEGKPRAAALVAAALADLHTSGFGNRVVGQVWVSRARHLLAACDRAGDVARAEEWARVITQTMTDLLGGRPRAMHTHCRLAYSGGWPRRPTAGRCGSTLPSPAPVSRLPDSRPRRPSRPSRSRGRSSIPTSDH